MVSDIVILKNFLENRLNSIDAYTDRGGAINLIAPAGITSKNAAGQATSGYLVDAQKVTEKDYKEWRAKEPEAFDDAFKREYDPASGLRFNAWIERGME